TEGAEPAEPSRRDSPNGRSRSSTASSALTWARASRNWNCSARSPSSASTFARFIESIATSRGALRSAFSDGSAVLGAALAAAEMAACFGFALLVGFSEVAGFAALVGFVEVVGLAEVVGFAALAGLAEVVGFAALAGFAEVVGFAALAVPAAFGA